MKENVTFISNQPLAKGDTVKLYDSKERAQKLTVVEIVHVGSTVTTRHNTYAIMAEVE